MSNVSWVLKPATPGAGPPLYRVLPPGRLVLYWDKRSRIRQSFEDRLGLGLPPAVSGVIDSIFWPARPSYGDITLSRDRRS